MTIDSKLLTRVRAEFKEMPCLDVTEAQASRLFGLSPDDARAALDALVSAGFLVRTRSGSFKQQSERSKTTRGPQA